MTKTSRESRGRGGNRAFKGSARPPDQKAAGRKLVRTSVAGASGDLTDERCPSGIEGLDDILGGGLPRGGFFLVQGDPGSGKTTLALQFLLEGMRRGEKSFYITLSETKEELFKVARSHGWSLEQITIMDCPQSKACCDPKRKRRSFIHPKSN